MEKKINEHLLAITGKSYLLSSINRDMRVDITGGELEVYSVEDKDNQDGTVNRVYKARFTTAPDFVQNDVIVRGKAKEIGGKKKKTKSQVFRIILESQLNEVQADGDCLSMDEKEYYDYIMNTLNNNPYKVHEFVKQINENK